MTTITITVQATPHGVVVHATGPLHALDDAAWVARSMIEHAAPLFAGGKPVLLGGVADPVQVAGDDEAAESTWCACDHDLTLQEVETMRCQACGKGLLL